MRHLLYRAFLNLVVQKSKRREPITDDLLNLAATCTQLAIELTRLTVSSIHVGCSISGTLQGIFYHALGYQWNAAVTLVLYAISLSAQEKLSPKLGSIDVVKDEIRSAVELFKYYGDAIPFAKTAAQKIEALLHGGSDSKSPADPKELAGSEPCPNAGTVADGPASMPDLDFSEFDFTLDQFEDYSNPFYDFSLFTEPHNQDDSDFDTWDSK